MEQQRVEEQLVWGKSAGSNDAAGAASCLCPGAAAFLAPAPFPRHALGEEVLHRADLQLPGGTGGGGDQRRERMIKNRQSAARSRARRHAYMNELEKEVSLLRAENEQLRKLCDELTEAAEAPVPVKRNPQQLQRTSSAAF